MHEIGIANSVLDAVRAESRRFPAGHIYKVGVRIGELAGVDPDAMSFCFEALVRGTELVPLALEIEYCARRYQCRSCGRLLCSTEGRFGMSGVRRVGFSILGRRRTGARLSGGRRWSA